MERPRHPLTGIDDHGGDLGRAASRFPGAPRPWLDLSTGINACSYPVPALSASVFERLPEEGDLRRLAALAAEAYGAPSPDHVACAPGTQVLLPMAAALSMPGQAAVLSPTYAEHRRAAALAGHHVTEVAEAALLGGYEIAFLVNPNNPDGRIVRRDEILRLAAIMHVRGGVLVVDQAFMDAGPECERVDGDVDRGGLLVLRSFGKFFGLAGVRLGFAIGHPEMIRRVRARLGPWPVSGPALAIGLAALADQAWRDGARASLASRAGRLDTLLGQAGLTLAGGTPLFRFVRHLGAPWLVDALGRRGILVRAFDFDASAMRFGIPAGDAEFERLADALSEWRKSP